jgi:K+-transporting ATPase KdpF subunit
LAFHQGGNFRLQRRFGPTHPQCESRGLIVDWTIILAIIVTVALVVYLTVALLTPEKFS